MLIRDVSLHKTTRTLGEFTGVRFGIDISVSGFEYLISFSRGAIADY
jgi:hypothetical protein